MEQAISLPHTPSCSMRPGWASQSPSAATMCAAPWESCFNSSDSFPAVLLEVSSRSLFFCGSQTFRSKDICNPFSPISFFFLVALCVTSPAHSTSYPLHLVLRCSYLCATPATEVSMQSGLQNVHSNGGE